MHPEPLPSPDAAELDALLSDPALRARWPNGFTSQDVLEELAALGRVVVDVRVPAVGPLPPFTCRVELRETGAVFGEGRSLTAAALRCLLEAEADLAAEVARGLDALGALLGDEG